MVTQQHDNGFLLADRYHADTLAVRGGAGDVWRGRDLVSGRDVAIRRIDVAGDRLDVRDRALRQAGAASRLRADGVVEILDVVDDHAGTHVIMEWIDAPDLWTFVDRNGPVPSGVAASWGVDLVDVLAAAHASGIVHGGIRPGSVRVGDGGARLTDFALARLSPPEGRDLSFLAPEQHEGRAAGQATDLYGLGAVLYLAVEGVPPFPEGQTLRPMPRAGPLEDLLAALLGPQPGRRPPLREVRDTLARVRRRRRWHAEVRAPAATGPSGVAPSCGHRAAVWLAAAAAALVLVAAAVAGGAGHAVDRRGSGATDSGADRHAAGAVADDPVDGAAEAAGRSTPSRTSLSADARDARGDAHRGSPR